MFKKTCKKCGSEFDVSLLKCLASSLAGFAIGWLIGLPDETINRILTENPGIAMFMLSRTNSSLLLGSSGFIAFFNSAVCQKCRDKVLKSS